MPSLPANVNKHPAYSRTYIAYDRSGYAFRVVPITGGWYASPSHAAQANDWRRFEGKTLAIVAHVIGRTSYDGSN